VARFVSRLPIGDTADCQSALRLDLGAEPKAEIIADILQTIKEAGS